MRYIWRSPGIKNVSAGSTAIVKGKEGHPGALSMAPGEEYKAEEA